MKIFAICDNLDTNIGLRLAGVDGIVVQKKEEIIAAIEDVQADGDIGILVITRKLAARVPKIINKLKLTASLPLVVEIPDRNLDKNENKDYITKYVKESIGIKV